jgi:Uma2 family endonuclease
MTTIISQPAPPASTSKLPPAQEQHFLISNVPWQAYVAIGNALLDRPGLRLTYDRGNLEFMTTSPRHEFYKKWLNRFIETVAEELNRPIAPGGNMTFERQDLEKGLEGDEVFWIEHEPKMRRKLTWDPVLDPPPDLALEIEVSRSVIDRLPIYAALKVSEVWTFDGTSIQVHLLQATGTYQFCERSQIFPEIPVAEMVRFLGADQTSDYLTAVREFRGWVRGLLGKEPQL